MQQRKHVREESEQQIEIETLLSTRYSQLSAWAEILARGDRPKAQDIVQEFCLYFVVTRPDLTKVKDLDAYLYTCLRHIFQSSMARASRDALRFVSLSDFDTFEFAVSSRVQADPLAQQNDLRRICNYALWRKEQSKSASYFILHFFHGYSRSEVADTAQLPMAAIYNKLKQSRDEIRAHLGDVKKMHFLRKSEAPQANLSWGVISTVDLFRELRQRILASRLGDCLPAEALLRYYSGIGAGPLPCDLLSHIVSCERCLRIIDERFRRPSHPDREPLDSIPGGERGTSPKSSLPANRAALEGILRRGRMLREHRPERLAIAHNGIIVAYHDVRSIESMLSARVISPEAGHFIEVFSEQDVRLALVGIEELPPNGPATLIQRIELPGARWLELSLSFDGLGLNTHVQYFDPDVVSDAVVNKMALPLQRTGFLVNSAVESPSNQWRRWWEPAWIGRLIGRPQMIALALLLLIIIATVGVNRYTEKRQQTQAEAVLNRSIAAELQSASEVTIHRTIQVQELDPGARPQPLGKLDIWKDGNSRRYVERRFDSEGQQISVFWKSVDGIDHSWRRESAPNAGDKSHVDPVPKDVWSFDLSPSGFATLGRPSKVVYSAGEYKVKMAGQFAQHPNLTAAELEMDADYRPLRATLQYRYGDRIRIFRLVATTFEREPYDAVPDSVFSPDPLDPAREDQSSIGKRRLRFSAHDNKDQVELQIDVLYQMSQLDLDAREPIEVSASPYGSVSVIGNIANDSIRKEFIAQLEKLPHYRSLHVHLNQTVASSRHAVKTGKSMIYEFADSKPAANEMLQNYFQSKGLRGEQLDRAANQYAQSALSEAQGALQDAFALERLGRIISMPGSRNIDLPFQQHWLAMVYKHANKANAHFVALSGLLREVHPQTASSHLQTLNDIDTANVFANTTRILLDRAQQTHRIISGLFTAGYGTHDTGSTVRELDDAVEHIPLQTSEQVVRFATRMRNFREMSSMYPTDAKVTRAQK